MFSGVLNYAFGNVRTSIPTWKVLYIFAGSWTVAWSVIILLAVPDDIDKARRLFSADERKWLKARVTYDQRGTMDKYLRKELLLEAVKDPLMYIYMVSCDTRSSD